MRHLRTETKVFVPAEEAWAKLTDFPSYPEWNPFISKLEGDISEGGSIKIGIFGVTLNPRVQRLVEDSNSSSFELRWLGHIGIPGIADGEHYFRLQADGERSARLVHGVRLTGILIPLLGLCGLFRKSEKGLLAMNEALKARVRSAKS